MADYQAKLYAALERIVEAHDADLPPSTLAPATHTPHTDRIGAAANAADCSKYGLYYGSCACCRDDLERDTRSRYAAKALVVSGLINAGKNLLNEIRGEEEDKEHERALRDEECPF